MTYQKIIIGNKFKKVSKPVDRYDYTQAKLDEEVKKLLDKIPKAFKELRQGQTWYCGSYDLDANDNVTIHIHARMITGKPELSFSGHSVHCSFTAEYSSGSAYCVYGGFKDPVHSNHQLKINDKILIAMCDGGRSRNKLKQRLEYNLSRFGKEIKQWLIAERQYNLEVMQDYPY